MRDILHASTISLAHQLLGLDPPTHPLISLLYHRDLAAVPQPTGIRYSLAFYQIGMKDGVAGSLGYGRNSYDFQEGTMIFIKPQQVLVSGEMTINNDSQGWTLNVHPDLFRRYPLGEKIHEYSFFSYEVTEALHLSQDEKEILTDIVTNIERETRQNIDRHTEELIVMNLETLLRYCKRYYDRQFYTRSNLNKDIVTQFESYLQRYLASDLLQEKGLPSVQDCGEALNLSGNYLSDLLRTETGKSTLEHIHGHVIEKAKNMLLSSHKSIAEIAYEVGFSYPQNFSRLFKSRTGMSPKEYQKSH